MTNPCKVCIVQPSCKISCDKLVLYIHRNRIRESWTGSPSSDYISKMLRAGLYTIDKNEVRRLSDWNIMCKLYDGWRIIINK